MQEFIIIELIHGHHRAVCGRIENAVIFFHRTVWFAEKKCNKSRNQGW